MKNLLLLTACAVALMSACSRVPITGRSQLNLIPASQVNATALTEYKQFLSQNPRSTDVQTTQLVQKVGGRIAAAVEQYFKDNRLSGLQGYNWEFNLVQSKEVNAWCMPGGKVVVYTGILPYTQNEAGLATVLGHEISHAVAQHGDERMSQQLVAQLGGTALDVALANKPTVTRQLFSAAYGAGAQYGIILPFNRAQESEADHLGLIFMSMAGYDPHEALAFWQRMSNVAGGKATPAFMSDHPADAKRIADLQQEMPQALKYYHGPAGN